jgi:hypothetical protein
MVLAYGEKDGERWSPTDWRGTSRY